MKSFSKKLDKQIGKISNGLKKIGIGAIAAGAGLAVLTKSAINANDELSKLSTKLGISTEDLSALKFAADFSGTSLAGLDGALSALTRRFNNFDKTGGGAAKDSMIELGIATRDTDGNLRNINDVFLEIAEKVSKMEAGIRKTAIVQDLFSKSQAKIIPLLNEGAEGLEAFKKEAESLGLILSQKTAKASEAFNDKLDLMGKSATSLGAKLAEKLLPALNSLADELVRLSKDEDFLKATEDSITSLSSGLVSITSFVLRLINAWRILFRELLLGIQNSFGFIEIALKTLQLKFFKFIKNMRAEIVGLLGFDKAKSLGIDTNFNQQAKEIARMEQALKEVGNNITNNNQEFDKFRAKLRQTNDVILETSKKLNKAINTKKAGSNFDSKSSISSTLPSVSSPNIQEEADKIKTFTSQIESFYDTLTDKTTQFADAFKSGFNGLEDALLDFTKTGKFNFSDMADSIINDIARIAIKQAIIAPLVGGITSFFGGGAGPVGADGVQHGGGFGGFFARGGRPDANKTSIIGENGPELFIPDTAGRVIPNNKLNQGGSNGIGGGNMSRSDVSININAVDTQTGVAFLISQKDTIAGIFNTSLNSNGSIRATL